MRRSLNLFDVVCIGLNAIVGSGIFLLPDDLYRQMGALSPFAFVLCLVGLLPVALCYAEAASRVDRTGGPYVYASEAFGPAVGFGVGWMCFANAVFSFAAVSAGAAAYFGHLVPAADGPWTHRALAILVIVVFAALNYRGAKPGAIAIDVFTVAKFAVLLLLIAALIGETSFSGLDSNLPLGLEGVGKASFIALFAAQGFEVVPVPAGETRKPQRDIPIGVVTSMLAASVLYVVVQLVLVGSYSKLGEVSDTPLANAAVAVVPALGAVIAIGGLVSMLGFVSGSAFGTPRYLYAAALDRHLPPQLATVHPRFESPHFAIIATAVLAALLASLFDYRALIGMSNVSVAVQYLATCLAVPVLRRRNPAATGFRVPFGPLLPALGALVSLWVFTEANREELAWAGGSLLVGIAAVLLTRRVYSRV
ncbi:MAG TPA: APC family permease [Polyangiales bacterium]|nr:APC family permease [Polyangiales bacterium]